MHMKNIKKVVIPVAGFGTRFLPASKSIPKEMFPIIDKPLIQTSQDPRIQAEGKAGQSADKGIIFVTESNFESEAGSEWVIGTCVKSPCVAAGNNELVSAYR